MFGVRVVDMNRNQVEGRGEGRDSGSRQGRGEEVEE